MKRNNKIFFIFLDNSLTGAPIIFNKYLEKALKIDFFDIGIYSRYKSHDCLNIENINFLHLYKSNSKLISFLYKCYDIFYFFCLYAVVKPEVVLVNSFSNSIPVLVAKLFNIKTIVIVHENDGAEIHFKFIRAAIIGFSNFVVVVSKASFNFCLNNNISSSKIKLINNGINLSDLKLRDNPNHSSTIVLGALANWSKYKRLDLIIDFFINLKTHSNIDFKLIVGGGVYEGYVDEFEKLKSLSNDIVFEGVVKDNVSFYKKLDGYLFFSEFESYPTVLMESLYFQVPVFSLSNNSSAFEVLGDALISENSVNQLSDKVHNFYSSDYISNYSNWHKFCKIQLTKNDLNVSWNSLFQLIIL